MSAAAAPAEEAPKKGSKKLVLIIAIVALLVLGGGGAAFFVMKKKAAAEAEAAEGEEGAAAPAKVQHAAPKPPPKTDKLVPATFVPLDPFVVNLADRDADRYAQIGMTLEVEDAKFAESMKGYMPAIRNGILMILAHKTAGELLTREGKEQLAEEVAREAVRPMGISIEEEEEYVDSKGRKKRRPPVYNPVQRVHFSNFIIQ